QEAGLSSPLQGSFGGSAALTVSAASSAATRSGAVSANIAVGWKGLNATVMVFDAVIFWLSVLPRLTGPSLSVRPSLPLLVTVTPSLKLLPESGEPPFPGSASFSIVSRGTSEKQACGPLPDDLREAAIKPLRRPSSDCAIGAVARS